MKKRNMLLPLQLMVKNEGHAGYLRAFERS